MAQAQPPIMADFRLRDGQERSMLGDTVDFVQRLKTNDM